MAPDSLPEITLTCSNPACGVRRCASGGQASGLRCVQCGSEMRADGKSAETSPAQEFAEEKTGDPPQPDTDFPLSLEVCLNHYFVSGYTTTFKCRITNHSQETIRGAEVVFRCAAFEGAEKAVKIRRALRPGKNREKRIEVLPQGAGQRVLNCLLRVSASQGVQQAEGEREVTVLERPESVRDLKIEFGHNALLGNEGQIDFGRFRSVNDFIEREFDKPFEAIELEELEPPPPDDLPEDYTNGLGMEFRRVAAGAKAVWFDRFPVTQALWERVMGESIAPRLSHIACPGGDWSALGESFPVYYVSHRDAEAFCRRLSSLEKASGRLPAGYGYRLPTVLEWACAAGPPVENGAELDRVAWHGGNSRGEPHPVGEMEANRHGLHDLRGNLFEWCRTTANPEADDKAPVRGGSWFDGDSDRKCCRDGGNETAKRSVRSSRIGFRVVLALCERVYSADTSEK